MRKRKRNKLFVAALACVLAICVVFLICVYAVQSSKIIGEDGLIAKARKEIKNLAEVETIDMTIAGKSTIENNKHLFWIITGNEYQMHRYIPIEFTEIEKDRYKFVHKYSALERGQDICVLMWHDGYSFIVNNPNCKSISILGYAGETQVTVDQIPFVYYYPGLPSEYSFFDEDGNMIP